MTEPLFILAPPRSFTSVICAMIGQHPQMLGLPETNVFARDTYAELHWLYRARGRLQHGLLRSMAQLGLGDQSPESVNTVQAWLESNPALTAAQLFRDLIAWAAPKGVVEKSPLYVYNAESLQRIDRAFPQARYLHVTRHPRGTCESIYDLRRRTMERAAQRVGDGGGLTAANVTFAKDEDMTPEKLWFDPHATILEFLMDIPEDRQMRIAGETLMADPDRHLKVIATWLGVSDGKDAIEAMKHPENSPFVGFGPKNALFGNDPSFLKDPVLRPYHAKPQEMNSPLSWDPALVFSDTVKELAEYFGYY